VGLFDITQLALDRAMTGAGVRQTVLANNVANVNTPGFVASDVDFHSAIAAALDQGQQVDAVQFSPKQTGASPDMDVQMADLSENALDYETLAAVSRTRLQMLSTVIGR
jgi:flagellar basal-body rod protein FlgB